MDTGFDFFGVMQVVIYFMSPFVVLTGILLLLYGNYRRMEETLGKDVGGIKKRIVPKLETNIYSFHEWLLEKRIVAGVLFVICGIVFYFLGRM